MDYNKYVKKIINYLNGPTKQQQKPNFGEEVKNMLTSKQFETQMKNAAPVLVGSMLAWPAYWLYRGVAWHKERHHGSDTLPLYINKTFYKAKMLQFIILSSGILYTIALQTFPIQKENITMAIFKHSGKYK